MKIRCKALLICCYAAVTLSSFAEQQVKPVALQAPETFGKTHFIVGMPPQAAVKKKVAPTASGTQCAYFAPDDDLQEQLIALINKEKKAIQLAIFSFTDKKIAQALIDAKKRGVVVELVADPGFLYDRYTKIPDLKKENIKIFIYDPKSSKNNKGTLNNVMHNKFVIFIENDGTAKVWTGSYNFTTSARRSNQENVVVLDDQQVIEKFKEQFQQLKKRTVPYDDKHPAIARTRGTKR